PALQRARETKRPAIVSTATLTLQEQIARHDASLLRRIVPDLQLVVLKGRAHYACLHAIELLSPGSLREMALESYRAGATEREAFPPEVQALWGQLSAANCDGDCRACPLKSAREAARSAELVVVNHALLLADEDGTVLPEFGSLVIDEAHRLIDVATEARSLSGTTVDLDALLEIGVPGSLRHAAHELHGLLTELILQTARALAPRLSGGDLRVSVRSDDPDLAAPIAAHHRMAPRLSLWLAAIAELPLFGPARLRFNALLNRIVDFALALDAFFAPPVGLELVRWFDFGDGSLHVAPLKVGPALESAFWRRCQGALLISATLAGPRGEFDFASSGLPPGRSLRLDSTFDYAAQCLLAVPGDLSPVSDKAHVREVARTILGLAFARNGRTLALFTSHAELKQVDELLLPLLEPRGIRVLAQGRSGERGALLEAFRAGGAVLLGTTTFWEGIDLIGDALEVLVISRLPFDVPTDPLHVARARLRRDPFRDYTLPRAAVRLRQGFGRLIRSERDRGVVVVLDSRLRERAYGAELAASLPECTLFTGARAELPDLARGFLDVPSASDEVREVAVG
ncbi:MAG TPA: ATP-dependent DNA helicase, partial [Anaeromyxobacteraceae bacterium]|nr:ATP-dependent DNA helicase [Anaeromyxobacteraceae bacterium]